MKALEDRLELYAKKLIQSKNYTIAKAMLSHYYRMGYDVERLCQYMNHRQQQDKYGVLK